LLARRSSTDRATLRSAALNLRLRLRLASAGKATFLPAARRSHSRRCGRVVAIGPRSLFLPAHRRCGPLTILYRFAILDRRPGPLAALNFARPLFPITKVARTSGGVRPARRNALLVLTLRDGGLFAPILKIAVTRLRRIAAAQIWTI
jgi:hypothetical protein